MKNKHYVVILLYILIYFSHIQISSAETSVNRSLQLELKEVTPTLRTISPIVPTIAQTRKEKNFRPKTQHSLGFQYNSDYISFGFLVPGDPLIRSDTIVINSSSRIRYNVFLMQDHPLRSEDGGEIPDATCDSGGCTAHAATLWASPLTFGFGVRCENSPYCSSDFKNDQYFRQLASRSDEEPPALILSGNDLSVEADITYKLNISPNQNPVPYSNTVRYVIIPQI